VNQRWYFTTGTGSRQVLICGSEKKPAEAAKRHDKGGRFAFAKPSPVCRCLADSLRVSRQKGLPRPPVLPLPPLPPHPPRR